MRKNFLFLFLLLVLLLTFGLTFLAISGVKKVIQSEGAVINSFLVASDHGNNPTDRGDIPREISCGLVHDETYIYVLTWFIFANNTQAWHLKLFDPLNGSFINTIRIQGSNMAQTENVEFSALEYDDAYLWVGLFRENRSETTYLWKINKSSGIKMSEIQLEPTLRVAAMARHASSMWIGGRSMGSPLIQVDITTGSEKKRFIPPTSYIAGLAYVSDSLWIGEGTSYHKVAEADPTTTISSYGTPGGDQIAGLDYADNYLWILTESDYEWDETQQFEVMRYRVHQVEFSSSPTIISNVTSYTNLHYLIIMSIITSAFRRQIKQY